jgi:hypothetical protein
MEAASRHRVRCALSPYKGPRTAEEAQWMMTTEDETRLAWTLCAVLKAKGDLSIIPKPFPEDVAREEPVRDRVTRLEKATSWHRREDIAFKYMVVQKFEELSLQKPKQDLVLLRPTYEL